MLSFGGKKHDKGIKIHLGLVKSRVLCSVALLLLCNSRCVLSLRNKLQFGTELGKNTTEVLQ